MSLLERMCSHQAASGSGMLQRVHTVPQLCPHALPQLRTRRCNRVVGHKSASSDEITPSASIPVAKQPATQQRIEDLDVKTRYIAETLLPTRHGKFRLRGYKHSVRAEASSMGCARHDHLLKLLLSLPSPV
jgi:hypothetical protein